MKSRATFQFVLVFLIPLIPVCVLYYFFGSQNYFSLDGWAKGLVASGPLAAYVFIVWMGRNLFFAIQGPGKIPESMEDLPGKWTAVSTSHSSQRVFTGVCTFEDQQGVLIMSGELDSGGKRIGDWNSIVAGMDHGFLYLVYQIEDSSSGNPGKRQGLARLQISDHDHLTGNWNVLGESGMNGTIDFERVKSHA